MANISELANKIPASAIRKLVPYAENAKAKGLNVYHLNLGAPDIDSPLSSINTLAKLPLKHVSYSHSAGMIELRRAFAEKYYAPLGINLTSEEIFINIGGSEGIDMVLKVCCNPGDEIIVMEPYYTNYSTFCLLNGVEVKAVSTDIRNGFAMPDVSKFESLITPKTKAIMISNPGNPTGTLYSKETMLALGEICRKHDLFLISDEVYREFCYTDKEHFSAMQIPDLDQNIILLDSVSKRYNLCGVRIGVLASHNKEIMNSVLKIGQARLCAPVFGQLSVLATLEDTPEGYFDALKKEYIARRDVVLEALNKMPGVFSPVPMGAFYTIAELPVDSAEKFVEWILTDFSYEGETIMITPAAGFYHNREKGLRQVRIAYVLEIEKLKRSMTILEKALEVYPGRI